MHSGKWWEEVDDPSALMRAVNRDDDPEVALGAICLALHCIGRAVIKKSLSNPMDYGTFDAVLDGISDHSAIPVMLVAFDEISHTPGYGASRLAELKCAADNGARRIVSKFRALGAPVQYGAALAGNVYGVPDITAMRYASRLEKDARANYGPVSKSLGMSEVINWAMMTAQAEQVTISKEVVEDDFFVRRGGKNQQRSVFRDSSTGQFASRGAGSEEQDSYFNRISRRKTAPILEQGAEDVAAPPQTRERLRPVEREREAVQELTAEEQQAAEHQEYRAKQLARYRRLRSYQGAVREGKRQAEARASEWLSNEAEQQAARKHAKEFLSEQGLARNERNLNRALELRNAAEQAERLQGRDQDRLRYLRASTFRPDAVSPYQWDDPGYSATDVTFRHVGPLKGITVKAPMLASYSKKGLENRTISHGQPNEAALARMYSGYDLNEYREGMDNDLTKKVKEVHSMARTFNTLHQEMNESRTDSKFWTTNPQMILKSIASRGGEDAEAAKELDSVFDLLPEAAWEYVGTAIRSGQGRQGDVLLESLGASISPEEMINEYNADEIAFMVKDSIDTKVAQLEGMESDESNAAIDPSRFVKDHTYSVSLAEALASVVKLDKAYPDDFDVAADSAARAYAIYGTAWSRDVESDSLVFLPTFRVKTNVEIAGTDYNGDRAVHSIELTSDNQVGQKDMIAGVISEQFRGGYIDSLDVSYTVEQTGFSPNLAPAGGQNVPPTRSSELPDKPVSFDPNQAVALLNRMGGNLLLPQAFTDAMSAAYPVLANQLHNQRRKERADEVPNLEEQIKTLNDLRRSAGNEMHDLRLKYPDQPPWDEK